MLEWLIIFVLILLDIVELLAIYWLADNLLQMEGF